MRPVLALGPAGTGVNFDERVVAVGFTRQQSLHRTPLRILVEAGKLRFAFLDGRLVAFGFAQLNQRDAVFKVLLQALIAIDGPFQRLTLAHDLLRLFLVVPEGGVFSLGV